MRINDMISPFLVRCFTLLVIPGKPVLALIDYIHNSMELYCNPKQLLGAFLIFYHNHTISLI